MAALRCTVVLLAVGAVFGQTASQTFHITTAPNTAALNEIATLIRTVGDIRQIAADAAKSDITVSGSDTDLALAAWLIKQFDTESPQPAEYAIAGGEDVVHTFYLVHTPTRAGLNELVTTLRVVTDIQRLFTYTPTHMITMRTTVAKAQLAEWLVHQLDVAPDDQARWQARETAMPGGAGQIVRVVYLAHSPSQFNLNGIVATFRAIGDIQRIFTRSEPPGIAMRVTAEQKELADWLLRQLDVQPDDQMRAERHEYLVPDVADGITRVYYLKTASPTDIATAIRAEAKSSRIFVCTEPKALTIRGTPEMIAIADRVIKEQDSQNR